MNFPLSQLSTTGSELTALSQKMKSLAAEADGINSAISGCYEQGGVGSIVGNIAGAMRNQASLVSQYGGVATQTSTIYESALDNVSSATMAMGHAIFQGVPHVFIHPANPHGRTALKVGSVDVVSSVNGQHSEIEMNPSPNEWMRKATGYAKSALKFGKGAITIGEAILGCVTIVGIPAMSLKLADGVNDMVNASFDATYVTLERYDMVGKTNILKESMADHFGDAGKLAYDTYELYDDTTDMLKSFGKIEVDLTGKTGYSSLWGEITFEDVMDNEFDKWSVKDRIKSYFMDANSTTNFFIEAAENVKSVFEKGSSVAEDLIEFAVK